MAHTVMGADTSHGLLFAGWGPREAGDVIQPESKGLRIRGADGVNPSPRARRRLGKTFQLKQ